ncbi:hypothetical protein C8C99_4487 [Acidovorax sp. 107]|nr:hypothetical protein C8C99_4487 [Acidovorax sp. 107]
MPLFLSVLQPAPPSPLIALLGAPHTGVEALAQALRQQIAPGSVRISLHHPHLTSPLPARSSEPDAVALTLLMGLDSPCPAGERTAQEATDAHLRTALAAASIPYRVVYGAGEQRIRNALIAIQKIAPQAYPTSTMAARGIENASKAARLRAWNCEKCSDPTCEHRLFTALVEQRDTPPPSGIAPDRA